MLTPVRVENDAGLSAVVYRVGTHGDFKLAMQTALARMAQLSALTTRDDDDASVALIDATATLLDVLTFYQERIANEGYLRTAIERRSLLELGRAIGYELNPGAAAEAHVAFTLDEAPGAPHALTLPPGTRVQSVPGPGEDAQTFETVEEIDARVEWNAIRPRLTEPQTVSSSPSIIWLEGTDSNLRVGDRVLVWGTRWTLHRVRGVAPDPEAKRTEVNLDLGVAIQTSVTPPSSAGVWALRVKSAPFGHNAPKRAITSGTPTTYQEWPLDDYDRTKPDLLTLDAEFAGITDSSLAVIGTDTSPRSPYLLANVQTTRMVSRAAYGVAARATQLQLPNDWEWESLGGGLTSAPAVASWGSGRLDVFIRGPDDALWHKWYQNGWSGWESLGGVLASDPAVASWGPGRLDVFVRGMDNALWHKWYQNGWSGWESLGGVLTSAPAVASWASGRLDVFVRGLDNALWHKWYQNGWSGWESLGGVLTSAPAAASWTSGRLDVFVRGSDNALWHKWYQGGWSGWESLGGVLTSAPAVASWASGRLDVFVRGADYALWHRWYQSGWSGWQSLSGVLSSSPAAAAWSAGRLDVFVRGTDNALWHRWYQGSWSSWESLGGTLTFDPAAVAWAKGRADLFVRGLDNALWHKWYQDGWSGWESLGGVITSAPTASSWGLGRLDVFARGLDGALWHKWYDNGWSGWQSLGGQIKSAPAAVSWGPGRIDVFARGMDDALWHKWYQNGWSSWESLTGILTSAPAAASWSSERLDVFVRGTDNALWHRSYQNGWSVWQSLGGLLDSAPAAASWGSGRLDVFVRGTDSALWHNSYESAWSGWESLGGVLASAPAALSWHQGRVDVFVRGADQDLWHRWWFTGDLGTLRNMVVFAQSQQLPLSERPIASNVQSPVIELDRTYEGLDQGRLVMVTGVPQGSKEPVVETAVLSAVANSADRTTIQLAQPLAHAFARTQVTFNANLALATHGETRGEVLGSGDASQPFQSFTLKQPPLTYVQASTPSGGRTTLEIRVNDLLWHEVPSLYGVGPTERVYVTRRRDDGKIDVLFGDGNTGARLPTGSANVIASYRVGVGVAANVAAGTITTLLSRPLGLREVRNPAPARGGSEPETRDRARRNAPLTVRTIDRVVSLLDYEDFASCFAGVGKAQAIWLWDGRARVVHLSVAGDAGEVLDEASPVRQKLETALETYRDPLVHVRVDGHEPLGFSLSASLRVNADFVTDTVQAEVRKALQRAFSFEARGFGQSVTRSEVLAVMQRVPGVDAVDLNALFTNPSAVDLNPPRLPAETARWNGTAGAIAPAQLLVLADSEAAVNLTVMAL